MNWDAIFRTLVRDGYAGFVALEPHCWPVHAEPAWCQAIEFVRPRIGGAA